MEFVNSLKSKSQSEGGGLPNYQSAVVDEFDSYFAEPEIQEVELQNIEDDMSGEGPDYEIYSDDPSSV